MRAVCQSAPCRVSLVALTGRRTGARATTSRRSREEQPHTAAAGLPCPVRWQQACQRCRLRASSGGRCVFVSLLPRPDPRVAAQGPGMLPGGTPFTPPRELSCPAHGQRPYRRPRQTGPGPAASLILAATPSLRPPGSTRSAAGERQACMPGCRMALRAPAGSCSLALVAAAALHLACVIITQGESAFEAFRQRQLSSTSLSTIRL